MLNKKKLKSGLHPRNKHRNSYDFEQLIASCPDLSKYVLCNKYGNDSIDFFNPNAVKMLNRALLKHFYGIVEWEVPRNYLTPPIPGRADYIHYIADLLASSNFGMIPKGNRIKCLDIGVGANCIYPIIGNREYGWKFIGSDIDDSSLKIAAGIIDANQNLIGNIELRIQANRNDMFKGVIKKDEFFDITICNPPFHNSAEDARKEAIRKISNLKKRKIKNPVLNFGGKSNELWCKGGEKQFVGEMIMQSKKFSSSCLWFTTLISKESNLKSVYRLLKNVAVADVKTIPMNQGNKSSRIVAWTFFEKKEQDVWAQRKWL